MEGHLRSSKLITFYALWTHKLFAQNLDISLCSSKFCWDTLSPHSRIVFAYPPAPSMACFRAVPLPCRSEPLSQLAPTISSLTLFPQGAAIVLATGGLALAGRQAGRKAGDLTAYAACRAATSSVHPALPPSLERYVSPISICAELLSHTPAPDFASSRAHISNLIVIRLTLPLPIQSLESKK